MNEAKAMTVEDRAKLILLPIQLAYGTPSKHTQEFKELIVEQIKQACDEARAEERELVIKLGGVVAAEAYAKGFAEAKEKAAKVPSYVWLSALSHTAQSVIESIAQGIRALEKDK